jgi:hypothetical protein
MLFAGRGVDSQFGLDGAQEPDLGDHLSGQFVIRHGRVVTVEPGSSGRGGPPLAGPLVSLPMTGHRSDQAGQLFCAGGQQDTRVRIAFQDRQIGLTQVTGQRGHRHQLPHQVLDSK